MIFRRRQRTEALRKAVEERVRAEEELARTHEKDKDVERAALAMWTHLAHNNFGPRFTEALRERRR